MVSALRPWNPVGGPPLVPPPSSVSAPPPQPSPSKSKAKVWAFLSIAWKLEANAKGYWDTSEENLQRLRDVYQECEDRIEGVDFVA